MRAVRGLLKGSVWDGGKKPIEKPPRGGGKGQARKSPAAGAGREFS